MNFPCELNWRAGSLTQRALRLIPVNATGTACEGPGSGCGLSEKSSGYRSSRGADSVCEYPGRSPASSIVFSVSTLWSQRSLGNDALCGVWKEA